MMGKIVTMMLVQVGLTIAAMSQDLRADSVGHAVWRAEPDAAAELDSAAAWLLLLVSTVKYFLQRKCVATSSSSSAGKALEERYER